MAARKILLVDDNTMVRRALARALFQTFTVYEAHNVETAIALIENIGGIELVVTDYFMHGMNGGDLLRHLRSEYPRIKVVLSSGIDHPLNGYDALLPKPVENSRALCVIRSLLPKDPTP